MKPKKNSRIYKALKSALTKYDYTAKGKDIDSLIEKSAFFETYTEKLVDMYTVRNQLMFLGNILEENWDKKTYISVLSSGFMQSKKVFFVTIIEEDALQIAAYGREGLIKQNLAERAVKDFIAAI